MTMIKSKILMKIILMKMVRKVKVVRIIVNMYQKNQAINQI